jgi:cellulose synthase/poly-beta-1,6-N-acetylglucosamine synthase-like glycosyltransferase
MRVKDDITVNLTVLYGKGYLSHTKYKTLEPFFPNCNLAFRREFLEKVDGYDEQLPGLIAEDIVICKRAWANNWQLYYDTDARVCHKPKNNFTHFRRQAWLYGTSAAHYFGKYQDARLEVFFLFEFLFPPRSCYRFLKRDRFPFQALLILGDLFLLNVLLLLIAGCLLFGHYLIAALLAMLAVALVRKSTEDSFPETFSLKAKLFYLVVTYCLSMTLTAAEFWVALKNRRLLICMV